MDSAAAQTHPSAVERTIEVDTPQGPGRVLVSEATHPVAVLALGHGAGGGVDASDLLTLAARLPAAGVSVLRLEQPWRTAGRKVAVAPPRLDQAWLSMLQQIRPEFGLDQPWLLGGRSAGARVACRTAEPLRAVGVVCLAFPLHPPGRPGSSRVGELLAAGAPRMVLQGSRDPFGGAAEVESAVRAAAAKGGGALAPVTVIELAGADHSLRVRPTARVLAPTLSPSELSERLVEAIVAFVEGLLDLVPVGE